VNRGDLKLRVSRLIGIAIGTDDDAVEEDDFLNRLANEAVLDVLSRTRVHVRDAVATMPANATEFDIDEQVLRMFGVKMNGVPLYEGNRDSLLTDEYAFAGFTRIVLGAATSAGDQMLFWYTPKPTPMSADSHDPSTQTYGRIPAIFHYALVDYMCWWAADKLGDQGAGRGEKYRVTYEGQDGTGGPGSSLGRIKTAVNARGSVVRVRRRRESLVSDREPSYWTG